jgi:ADP-heptose:LPS heptosyltransferase
VRIVAFKLNHLGDNVVFVPAIQALRQRLPDWDLTLLTTPAEAELYGGPLRPQEVLTCAKAEFNTSYRRPWELARWILRIRGRHPDACLVSFDQGTAAHAVARFSGARVRVGAGLEPTRMRGALTEEVPIPADSSPATWHWEMARALARSFGSDEGWPGSPPPPDLRHLVPDGGRPRGARRRVVVHSGASRALNQWPQSDFAAVAGALADDFEVVWIGHGGTTGPAPQGALHAPVGSIRELAGWLAGADLFLGNNSGPMHLANALGTAGVAVTGPSARGWDPYWHRGRWTVLRHPSLSCAPCERIERELHGCANTASPMACLRYWTPAAVEAACRDRLARPEGALP